MSATDKGRKRDALTTGVQDRVVLLIDGWKHIEWHRVFGNRTLPEVIALLKRVQRAKSRQWKKVA